MIPLSSQEIAEQLHELPSDKRIIFAHPNFKAQHLLLDTILENAVYVCVQGHHLDEAQLQEQIDQATKQQAGKTHKGATISHLVLDECDRLSPEALTRFLRRFLGEKHIQQVIVLSHILPDHVLMDEEVRSHASFIPSDPKVMLWDYAQNADTVLLEVRAFGDGRVHLNGHRVDSWDGALPRALFFYLIDRGMVTRAEIFQTFWPTLSTREATNVFHVTKRKISEVLGTELTVYGSAFYHVSPKIELSYDVSLFHQLVQESENAEGNGDLLRQALSLYRGDYLMSLKTDWVLARRESLQQSACDALTSLGKICESQGKPREALGSYLQAARLKPEREDSAYAVMRLYRDQQMPGDALKVYQRLVNTLRTTLRVAPSAQVQQLAAQLETSA